MIPHFAAKGKTSGYDCVRKCLSPQLMCRLHSCGTGECSVRVWFNNDRGNCKKSLVFYVEKNILTAPGGGGGRSGSAVGESGAGAGATGRPGREGRCPEPVRPAFQGSLPSRASRCHSAVISERADRRGHCLWPRNPQSPAFYVREELLPLSWWKVTRSMMGFLRRQVTAAVTAVVTTPVWVPQRRAHACPRGLSRPRRWDADFVLCLCEIYWF